MPVCLEEPQILKDVRLQTCVEFTQVEKTVTVHAAVQDVVGEQGRGPDPIGAHTPEEILEALPTRLQKQ